jgi:tetratricopeptide (TPR) repeat protein
MKFLLLGLVSLLLLADLTTAQPPLLKGQVKRLDGALVKNTPIRLLEPDVNGSTDQDGVFKIRLPANWKAGKQITLLVQLAGYAVLRPWEGKITIQEASEEKLENIIIAKDSLVQLVNNPAELERRILQPTFEAQARARTEPQTSSEFDVLRQEARHLNISLTELVALLNEWKKQAQERGTLYEKALAALYEKQYGEAIKLLSDDIAADERDITHADRLKVLLPRKYLNLGIAHAGKYEHAEAEQAHKKALALKPDLSEARIHLADTYRFTGRFPEALALLRIEAQRHSAVKDSALKTLYSSVLGRIGCV